jgi:phage terminase small subunit
MEKELAAGSYTVETRTGERANPLVSAMLSATQSMQALTRTLGLSASQRSLTGGVQKKRNEADARARDVISRVASDDLLG